MSNSQRILVVGDVTIYFRQGLTLSNVAVIRVAPTGWLQVWSGGAVQLGGQGVQGTLGNMRVDQFVMFGLPSCRNISITTSGPFVGVIYAPQAQCVLGAGIVTGSCTAESVRLAGALRVHFDEALRRVGDWWW